jgi:predicted transcriptional regulator of viral defense system
MSFEDLRKGVEGEIFDYQMLMHHLSEFKKPRDKATLLLKNHSIIRVKKGLYIFGPNYQRKPISLEILANAIYSPSYLSLEYALSKYGLIPERVYAITSICLKRSRTFTNSIGTFVYKTRPLSVYPIGIQSVEVPREGNYLIATPEKALVDFLAQRKEIKDVHEMKEHLYENLRMEQSDLKKFNKKLLTEIIVSYKISHTLIKAIYD